MAKLNGVGRSLRFALDLVDSESPAPVPGEPKPKPALGRLLGSVSMEYFDKRDQAYWPMIHLPVVWLGLKESQALMEQVSGVVRAEQPGFAFRSSSGEVALQIGTQPQVSGFVVEVGLDLGNFLFNVASAAQEPGRDLALFRFGTDQPALVAFGDGLRQELKALER